MDSPPTAKTCAGTTKAGKPCRARPSSGSKYCWRHVPATLVPKLSKLSIQPVNPKYTELEHQVYVIKTYSMEPSVARLLLFDMDGTLINIKYTRNIETFRQRTKQIDQQLKSKIPVLLDYQGRGWHLGLYTNQSSTSKSSAWQSAILERVGHVVDVLAGHKIHINAYVAGGKNSYRKPMTDMITQYLPSVTVQGIYCGDMAGRVKDPGFTDYYLVHNLNINQPRKWLFAVPEQFFSTNCKGAENYEIVKHPYRDNLHLDLRAYRPRQFPPQLRDLSTSRLYLIIMVGPPASGKSSLARYLTHLYTGVSLSTDQLGSLSGVKKSFKQAVQDRVSPIIIDNTNPRATTRQWYLDNIPKSYQVMYIWYDFPLEFAFHMNNYRVQSSHSKIYKIPIVAYRTYYKYLQAPPEEQTIRLTALPDIPGYQLNEYYEYWYETK